MYNLVWNEPFKSRAASHFWVNKAFTSKHTFIFLWNIQYRNSKTKGKLITLYKVRETDSLSLSLEILFLPETSNWSRQIPVRDNVETQKYISLINRLT
jgi:hypothetical protein